MIIVGGLSGTFLTVKYFQKIKYDYLREGIITGLVWLLMNWVLDLILFKFGFFGETVLQYFTEIGFGYFMIWFYPVGVGYILQKKQQTN